MKTKERLAATLLAVALIAPLLVVACGSTVSATIDDATVTTRVKTVLINDPGIEPQRIDVGTVRGVVTLSGHVRTREEESKAIALARGVRGVADVKSTLQIQPQ
jgi:osmotically-inducible protein OsmY